MRSTRRGNANQKWYPALGLAGETGEVIEIIKKVHRDFNGVPQEQHLAEIPLELGDVLWYLTSIGHDYNLTLDQIMQLNKDKLTARDLARGRSAA